MKILLIFSIIVNLINIPVYADDVTFLEKDQKAPFQGVLFPRDQAVQLRKDLIDADLNKALNESYKKSLDLYKTTNDIKDEQINLLINRNDQLAKSLNSARETTGLEKFAWFALGVAATAATVYGIKKITQ